MFLPTHSPYDRQVLIEHVVSWARSERLVQVLDGKRRWHFRVARDGEGQRRCSACGRAAAVMGQNRAGQDDPHCAPCALGDGRSLRSVADNRSLAA